MQQCFVVCASHRLSVLVNIILYRELVLGILLFGIFPFIF